MKKLSTVIILAALLMPVTSLAQTETLIGRDLENGGFGGPTVKFSQFAGELGLLVGGGGGWVIDKTFTIGGAGFGLVTTNVVNNGSEEYEIGFGYGGLLLEYLKRPDDLIHYYATCIFALGGLSFRAPGSYVDIDPSKDDMVYIVEPSVNVCLNLTKSLKVSAGAGYRYVTGLDQASLDLGIEETGLTGASFNISFRFGRY